MTNEPAGIGRCYRCLRPQRLCYCATLPVVPTRTDVVVLQHPHERTHPFGTARLVGLCLPRARVHVAYAGAADVLRCEPDVPPDTVVLWPRPDAPLVEDLREHERPSTLLAIDGTWAHAKRLYADNPWLSRLRHVRIDPAEPSRYRIRREPRADYVSTLEAIVAALRAFEPDNHRLGELVDAFDRMIDQQVHLVATVPRVGRTHRARLRESRALSPLLADPGLVVAYAEASAAGADPAAGRELVQWAAVRPTTGETFEAILRPTGRGPTDAHLDHMALSRADLANGDTAAGASERFRRFLGDGAPVTAWTSTSLAWGAPLLPEGTPTTVLKTNYCNATNHRAGYLEDVVAREHLTVEPVPCHGRAAIRLGQALAIARWLELRTHEGRTLPFATPRSTP